MNDPRQAPPEQALAALRDAPVFEVWYLGAFAVLQIQTVARARELADLTRTIAEASAACIIMAQARPGDRVYPALEFLRQQRAQS